MRDFSKQLGFFLNFILKCKYRDFLQIFEREKFVNISVKCKKVKVNEVRRGDVR